MGLIRKSCSISSCIKHFNWNFILIPVLCVPMVYQCWLLWDEFHNGLSPSILYQAEPNSDLPAVTICVPHIHLFSQSFVNLTISRAAGPPKNGCVEWKIYLKKLESGNLSSEEEDKLRREIWFVRQNCYNREYLTARDKDGEALFTLDDVISEESEDTIQASQFIQFNIDTDDQDYRDNTFYAKPNHVSLHPKVGKCWTYFSRTTRQWWTTRNDSDLLRQAAHRGYYYRIPDLRMWSFHIDPVSLLAHYYQIDRWGDSAALLNKLAQEWPQLYTDQMISDVGARLPAVLVRIHSPYTIPSWWEYNIERSSSTPLEIMPYAKDTLALIKQYKTTKRIPLPPKEDVFTQSVIKFSTYTKTTVEHLQRLDEDDTFSDYFRLDAGHGFAQAGCGVLRDSIVEFTSHVTNLSEDRKLCINLFYRARTTPAWDKEISDIFNVTQICEISFPACESCYAGELSADQNVTLDRIKEKSPHCCPADRTKLVNNFRPETHMRRIDMTTSSGNMMKDTEQFKGYVFSNQLDSIPEMTIRYVAKMSTIELLANLAGLSGIWLGFSLLQFAYQLHAAGRYLKAKLHNFIAANQSIQAFDKTHQIVINTIYSPQFQFHNNMTTKSNQHESHQSKKFCVEVNQCNHHDTHHHNHHAVAKLRSGFRITPDGTIQSD